MLEVYLVDRKKEKKSSARITQEINVFVYRKQPALFLGAPSFYVRTYILWATAGTTGKIVVNLRSRNTKQTQMMRATTTAA